MIFTFCVPPITRWQGLCDNIKKMEVLTRRNLTDIYDHLTYTVLIIHSMKT